MTACWLCIWALVVVLQSPSAGSQRPTGLNKRHDVYIAGFFPFGRHVPESSVGRGVMPAVKLAVDHINESPTVLRNYRLHMWWNDTEVINNSIWIYIHNQPFTTLLFIYIN